MGKTLKPGSEKAGATKERQKKFTTTSGVLVEPLYTSEHLRNFSYERDLGDPGSYPYTRGIHRTMYRGKLWTMRQFSGFGSPEDTNRRLHYLLKQGQTGLSIAFDLPTLMGYDSDHPLAEGEVGKCGVAVSSLADMETLLDLYDHQFPGGDDLGHVPGGGRKERDELEAHFRHDPERHS